jgi:hypothetical protein
MPPWTPPTAQELEEVCRWKYGPQPGWGPQLRKKFQYFTPDDIYETVVERIIAEGSVWHDVGGGHHLFPSNTPLAEKLTRRCRLLVGIDPSENIEKNPFVHERARCALEDYRPKTASDVATARMVIEHVQKPALFLESLARLVRPGGYVVLYTVDLRSAVTWISRLVPFALHHPLKKLLWGTEDSDTFPTVYKMNTREDLRRLLADAGFDEVEFQYLDDCRIFGRYRALYFLELLFWRTLKKMHLRYPERCLLGIYRRR